jgi:hypothetical protein
MDCPSSARPPGTFEVSRSLFHTIDVGRFSLCLDAHPSLNSGDADALAKLGVNIAPKKKENADGKDQILCVLR